MIATKEADTILSRQALPSEPTRSTSSRHRSSEPRLASIVSGIVAVRHPDDVICPLMLKRHLLLPARDDAIGWSFSHIR